MEPPLTQPDSPLEREQGASVFFSYAHRDKGFRDRLEEHLSNLKYRGLVTTWHDREISAGEEWAHQIDIHLNEAQVILLLISASFMASEYCYSIEMRQALERQERHEADVIPILLRPVLYTDAPFAKLQMLPTNGKPIVLWRDRDSAFVDIAYAIERVAQKYVASEETTSGFREDIGALSVTKGLSPAPQSLAPPTRQPAPKVRSRNLPLLLAGIVGLFACILASSSLFLFRPATNTSTSSATPTITTPNLHPSTTASIPTPTPTLPAPTPTPTPAPNPAATPTFIIILGILLLVGIIVAIVAIRAIRAKNEQRRAQEASEEARKRGYYEQAIEAYLSALEDNPRDADALRGMGNALYALGRYDQARDYFRQAVDCDPIPAAYAGLGDVFAKLKRYNEAVEAYEKAIELDPTVTLNYGGYMQALQALGKKEEAERVHASARQRGFED